jgi:8-amino-7-oxononanoate synthase
MLNIEQQLNNKLTQRKEDNALRVLPKAADGLDFCSNDYLGLAKNQLKDKGSHGSTGSRLISGNSTEAEQLELFLASFHKGEGALLYNSGYDANLGLLSCIASRNDTYIIDELCHASIYDGVRLSNAKVFKFKHNCIEELKKKIKNAEGNIFVVVESVYSMDGDFSPLTNIAKICKQYNANLIVDEAHATGVFGEKGEGRVIELGLENECFARVHTFGKALGCHGAVIVGSVILKDYLINFSRSFIYTTALPESSLFVIENNYHDLKKENREKLKELINYFKNKFEGSNFIESDSPIQSLIVPGNEKVKHLANKIQKAGMIVKAILHPTVPIEMERIRICLHSYNTTEQIDLLFDVINDNLSEY